MLIDTVSVHYSGSVANTTITNPSQDRFINAWAGLLKSVGWTQVAALHASASVVFPLGAPITAGVTVLPLTVVGCAAYPGSFAIGDQSFTFYDPFTEIPGPGLTCIMVEMDTTFAGTLANLVTAINASTPWFATLTQNTPVNFTLSLTALAGGPEFNYVTVQSSGWTTGNDRSSGGGYHLRSAADSDSAVYDCAVTNANAGGAGVNYLAGNIKFDFTINGTHLGYQLLDATQGTLGFMGSLGVGAVPAYTIVANPYGFAVFDIPRNTTTAQFRAVSLFAMAPYFPTSESVPESENFIVAYAVFIVGPNQIGGAPSWNNFYMSPSVMCLDSTPFTTSSFNPSARLLSYRSPTTRLLTPHGIPINIGAYVQFGSTTGNASPAWVVGKLWDCALISDYVATGAVIDDKQFMVLGGSDGSDGQSLVTLLMCSGTAIIPEPDIPPPSPPPPPKSGTVNLFGDGVTWVSGDKFTAGMVGQGITIAGESYIVLTFTDDEHLVLTTAKTIASGATYSAP